MPEKRYEKLKMHFSIHDNRVNAVQCAIL